MSQKCKSIIVLALAFVLALGSVLPADLSVALAETKYGKVTADQVFVRKQASTSADYWFRVNTGYECQILGTVKKGDVTWYKVKAEHPDDGKEKYYNGYIHGGYFLPNGEEAPAEPTETSTASESAPTPTPTPTPTPAGGDVDANLGAAGMINAADVNLRSKPDASKGYIRKLALHTVVDLLTIPGKVDQDHWYKVRYNGEIGYVQAPYIDVLTTGLADTKQSADKVAGVGDYGFVELNAIYNSANMRLTPGGEVEGQWLRRLQKSLPVRATIVRDENGKLWYPVVFNGKDCYVSAEVCHLVGAGDSSATSAPTDAPTPTATLNTSDIVGYVVTTVGGVNLRLTRGGTVIQQLKRGVVVPYLHMIPADSKNSYAWYYVDVDGVRGYLRSDCVRISDSEGDEPATTTPPASTEAPDVILGYLITTETGVNLRKAPGKESQEQIKKGVILPVIGQPEKPAGSRYTWYYVRAASGRTGYLRSDCIRLCDVNGDSATLAPEGTASPTTSTAPTATPAPTDSSTSAYGYVKIISKSVNVRKTAGGDYVGRVDKGEIWPMTGEPVKVGSVTWYPIKSDLHSGYVHGDHAFKLSPSQEADYLAGKEITDNAPAAGDQTSTYLITILDDVYLRASASKESEAKHQVDLGTVLAYNNTQTVAGKKWYRVVYKNEEVWVLGTCVQTMTKAEYDAWLATNPESTPQPEVMLGYVITTDGGVNLRNKAAGNVIGRVDKGVIMPYIATERLNGKTWYYVRSPLGHGYLHGDFVEICDSTGDPLPTTPPVTTGTNGGDKEEATYSTLRRGSVGTAVKRLVTELKNQGYYTGTVTNTYTSAVEKAVRAFQKAKNLTVDGIAGSETQHALFGTVPPGSSTDNLTFTFYPAEKIDWFTGGIQDLWPKGKDFKIYDVKTGIVWWAHRWSGGFHADIEPLTAADTARLCEIYGVDDAQEIYDKNMWQRRPCLVTIGNRTFACSLDGMPHNPDGDTIKDNNMTGQICLHFTNSKGHESGKVSDSHQEAIDYAWKHAPNGHK